MTAHNGLVLDANILLRAVLGRRVMELLETYEEAARFYSPDVCFEDAHQYLHDILERRGRDPAPAVETLRAVSRIVQPVDVSLYRDHETIARERVQTRDPDDWPVVAVALLLDLPIWTEDQDLFGTGVATWTTDRVELYLRSP